MQSDPTPPLPSDGAVCRLRRLSRGQYLRNMLLMTTVEAVWGFGVAVCAFSTVVAFLLKRLGASDRIVGSLSAAYAISAAIPQLYCAYRTEHLPRKLVYFILAHYPACVAFYALGAVTRYADALGPELACALILACVAVFGLSMGMVMPVWVNLMDRTLPPGKRNTLWGWMLSAGPVAGLFGAWASHRLLADLPGLAGYAACALAAGAAVTVSINLFWGVVEPADPAPEKHESFARFVRTHFGRAWSEPGFRRLLFWRLPSAAASGGILAFLAVAAKERFDLPDSAAALFAGAAVASQIVHGLWAGWAGDRFGNRVVAVVSPALVCVAGVLALLAPSPVWTVIAFGVVGGIWIIDVLSVNGLLMDYCRATDKTPIVALMATLLAPVSVGAPVAAGFLAETAGYTVLFAACTVLAGAAAIGTALWVVEPRTRAEESRPESLAA